MGLLTEDFEAKDMPIYLLSETTILGMGFTRIGHNGRYTAYERAKYGYLIKLKIPISDTMCVIVDNGLPIEALEGAIVTIYRVRKSGSKGGHPTIHRVMTMETLIEIINKCAPRSTYGTT